MMEVKIPTCLQQVGPTGETINKNCLFINYNQFLNPFIFQSSIVIPAILSEAAASLYILKRNRRFALHHAVMLSCIHALLILPSYL
jgi:hypothetical protein